MFNWSNSRLKMYFFIFLVFPDFWLEKIEGMNFSSPSVCDKQLCIFWCPFATFSLRHFSLAKSVDVVKNWLCWKVALGLQNVFIF